MYLQTLLIALIEIRRNAMRSFLTILGIIIGVAAVIIMSTIGGGATAKVTADIAKLGSNMLSIRPGQMRGPGGASAEAKPLEMADIEAIERDVKNLEAVAPTSSKGMTIVYGNINWSTSVIGTTNKYLDVRDWEILMGRAFTDSELRTGKMACIIGETVRKELFGGQDPVGENVRLGRQSCKVVGILKSKGQSSFGTDQDDTVLIPLQAFQRRISGNRDIARIYLSVNEGSSTETAREDISALLRERRRIGPKEGDDFSVFDMKEVSDTMAGTTEVLTTLLSAVAAVSLLVGGIGIMNIMLVSVTERTREIGVRLAIGAREREVLLQFLVEAVVLSTLGGIMGILFGVSSSFGLTKIFRIPYVLDPFMIVVAFIFSTAIGVLFGFFPARKAARLNPIDALRHE
ncbi:MAG: multidrug ABC transporter substrate-binding protein [Nitrospira bacterium SG8_35_1]|nr:MAG: multidrug ABC transporter substrate-binding protein [Nitrospira bacterium SG8_35_1]